MDINHGNARSTLGNNQNLAPQSKNMKKKLNNIPNRKFSTRSESKSIIPKKTLLENLNPNFQPLPKESNPHTSPIMNPNAMQGMHANGFDSHLPFVRSPTTTPISMQGMHVHSKAATPMHILTTLNLSHHSAVSFPKLPKPPNLTADPSSSRSNPCSSHAERNNIYLDGDPPDNGVNQQEGQENVKVSNNFHIVDRTEDSLSNGDVSVVADSAMEFDSESLERSQ